MRPAPIARFVAPDNNTYERTIDPDPAIQRLIHDAIYEMIRAEPRAFPRSEYRLRSEEFDRNPIVASINNTKRKGEFSESYQKLKQIAGESPMTIVRQIAYYIDQHTHPDRHWRNIWDYPRQEASRSLCALEIDAITLIEFVVPYLPLLQSHPNSDDYEITESFLRKIETNCGRLGMRDIETGEALTNYTRMKGTEVPIKDYSPYADYLLKMQEEGKEYPEELIKYLRREGKYLEVMRSLDAKAAAARSRPSP
jgi:hypothetical protein